jgi:hypothetical protein
VGEPNKHPDERPDGRSRKDEHQEVVGLLERILGAQPDEAVGDVEGRVHGDAEKNAACLVQQEGLRECVTDDACQRQGDKREDTPSSEPVVGVFGREQDGEMPRGPENA